VKLPASPWDIFTSTGRDGKVRFDARKSFEAGAFIVSTWAFVYLTLQSKLTEWFFIGYMTAWTVARYLRDREQRLTNAPAKRPDNPDA
jgi:hypothetical protein